MRERIEQNAEVVGSDETFFDGDPINIHDLYNEKSGIFDEEDDKEVDLASYSYQIWKNATDADPTLAKTIPDLPNVIYATKQNTMDKNKSGVIVYTRTSGDNDVLAWLDQKSQKITQSQYTILKAAECYRDTIPLDNTEVPINYKCPFLNRELWISATGQISPCCAPDEQRKSLGDFGNIQTNSLSDVLISEGYQKLVKEYYNHPLCRTCTMRK